MFRLDRAPMSILIAIGTIASVAFSHRGMAAECPDPIPEKLTAAQFIACVKKVKENVVPSGTVIAFDLEEGCPMGWSKFTNAAGKVIIGVGEGFLKETRVIDGQEVRLDVVLEDHEYRAEGGEENINLPRSRRQDMRIT